ncbi:hypothetical protein [Flavobacterium cauense]|nr:hypothetical protein [Flavobacterium cauense]
MKSILSISVMLFGLAFLCLGNQSATIQSSKYSLEKEMPFALAHSQTNYAVASESCVRCHDCSGAGLENDETIQNIVTPSRIGVEKATNQESASESVLDDTATVKPEVADRFVQSELN